MKKILFCIITLVMLSCNSEKTRCWSIYIEAFGLTEERYFYGSLDEVVIEAQRLRELSQSQSVNANIYYEPNDWRKADCKK